MKFYLGFLHGVSLIMLLVSLYYGNKEAMGSCLIIFMISLLCSIPFYFDK